MYFEYKFHKIEECNLCGAKRKNFKILGKRLNQSQGKNPKGKIGITVTIVKCKNCGLVFSNPQPIPKSIEDHYGVPPENYWQDNYFKIDENYFLGEIKWLKKLIAFKPGIKTLDIGAGLGKCMITLKKQGCETYGLEPSEMFYYRAIEKMGINKDRLKLTSAEEAKYAENFFDFITFGATLEHLYDPSACILKAIKWLKPKGVIHIEVPSSDWLTNKIANIYYSVIGTDYVSNISPMHLPYHLYEFSLKSFEEHSKRFGYEIADYDYYVCQSYLPKIIDLFVKPYMKWTNTGMQIVVWLRKK